MGLLHFDMDAIGGFWFEQFEQHHRLFWIAFHLMPLPLNINYIITDERKSDKIKEVFYFEFFFFFAVCLMLEFVM